MSKQRNAWHVVKDGDDWAVKRAGGQRASSRHTTQREAEIAAKRFAGNQGGGEITIHRPDGFIRDKDTVTSNCPVSSSDVDRIQLEDKLRVSFESDVFEDGMDHPAEQIIATALQSSDAEVLHWLRSFSLNGEHPWFASSVLRCLGRHKDPGSSAWRINLVRDALDVDDLEIRAAAVQAAELWADQDLEHILGTHKESDRWLSSYIQDVIEDLESIR